MKSFKKSFRILIPFIFSLLTIGITYGQGVYNTFGDPNAIDHTGGYNWIGDESNAHLSLDPNEVQARMGQAASTLFLIIGVAT